MKLSATPLAGMYEAATSPLTDDRGKFARLFCVRELAEAHQGRHIVQINLSVTRTVGALRGLHFQRPPHAEGKWIRCLRGSVFDVAVDLRRGSPTFRRWHGVVLSADTKNAVFIPEGCAHGFQVLTPDSELLYLHTNAYAPQHEGGVRFDDPSVSIAWPLPITDVSGRDRSHPHLSEDFKGIEL